MRQSEPQALAENLSLSFRQLKESRIIDEAVLFDEEGNIISSAGKTAAESHVGYKDISRAQELKNIVTQDKWFLIMVDEVKKRIFIYLAIQPDPQVTSTYTAKLSFDLGNIRQALKEVYSPVIIATLLVILANILLGYILSKTIVGPVKILNEVTKIIAGGDLTIRARIETNDELEELGSTFNYMTEELVKMKERAENANPLTKLPGNIVIREEVEKRISENKKFTVIYCDLDNFKAFNDKYGIAKGDEAIKLTAEVFKESIKNSGNPEDFLGHEGGDDFILLTSPDKAQGIAGYIIKEFDISVRALYNQEDLKSEYITAHARDGAVKQFPIMAISLAGVSNETRPITSYAEVTNIAAEVKKKSKAIEGSSFVLDKRLD